MAANPQTIFETIEFTLNGASVEALPGETILQAAERCFGSGDELEITLKDAEGLEKKHKVPFGLRGDKFGKNGWSRGRLTQRRSLTVRTLELRALSLISMVDGDDSASDDEIIPLTKRDGSQHMEKRRERVGKYRRHSGDA